MLSFQERRGVDPRTQGLHPDGVQRQVRGRVHHHQGQRYRGPVRELQEILLYGNSNL